MEQVTDKLQTNALLNCSKTTFSKSHVTLCTKQITSPTVSSLAQNVQVSSTANCSDEHLSTDSSTYMPKESTFTASSINGTTAATTKRKQIASGTYPCDECSETFSVSSDRTLHKIRSHDGRPYRNTKKPKVNHAQFMCDFPNCNRSFSKKYNLNNHFATHKSLSTNRSYFCEICGEVFLQKIDLSRHARNRHTGTGEYPCTECSKKFYTYDTFVEHCGLHDMNIPKHKCECGKEFLSLRKFKEHSIIHKERVMFKCDVCNRVFLRSQTLQYHRITCKAAFPCEICVDSFMTKEGLIKHSMLHRNQVAPDRFTCKKCNKVFSSEQALANHERRHSLRLNYICIFCKGSVSTRSKFQKHIKDHLEADLRCPICNESFQSLVKYGYHKVEKHSIMRPYNCILCTEQFCTRHELFLHLHNHMDINNSTFECDKCPMRFTCRQTYDEHSQAHPESTQACADNSNSNGQCAETSAKTAQYKCLQCNETFNCEVKLAEHTSSKHPVQRFPCALRFCNQIFEDIKTLAEHQKLAHTDLSPVPTAENQLCQPYLKCSFDGCTQVFSQEHHLKKHSASHAAVDLKCVQCQSIGYERTGFEEHIRECHPRGHISVQCSICRQYFENDQAFKCHACYCGVDDKSKETVVERKGNFKIEEIYLKASNTCYDFAPEIIENQ